MATFGDLVVKLTLDKTGFDRNASALQSSLAKLQTFGKGLASGFVAVTGAITAAGAALAAFLKPSFDAIDEQAKLADRLGITTEALAGLQHIGELSGVDGDTLATSLQKLQINLSKGSKAFEELGLDARKLKLLAPEEQFAQIADAINRLPTAADRLRAVTEIFGRGGAPLLNVLAEGSAGIRAAAAEADRLGLAVSRMDARRIEEANDAVTRMESASRGLANTLAIAVAPAVELVANMFTQLGVVAIPVIHKITDAIKSGVIDSLRAFGEAFKVLGGGAIGQALFGGQLDKQINAAIAAIQGANAVGGAGAGGAGAVDFAGGAGRGPQLPTGAIKGSREAVDRLLNTRNRNQPEIDLLRKHLEEQKRTNQLLRNNAGVQVKIGMFS